MIEPMTRLTLPCALALFLLVLLSAVGRAQAPAAGRTVWEGVFTAEQAERGRPQYSANCAECHGTALQGGEGAGLVGDAFWQKWTAQTVGDFVTYISKNMPFSEDGSKAGTLSPGTYAEIAAHILNSNGFPTGTRELTAASGAGVRIIPKDGPGELPASTLAHVVGCLAPRGADGTWKITQASPPERISSSGAPPNKAVGLGNREFALKFVLRSLTSLVGHKLSVTGLLLGVGGVDGLNVSSIDSIADSCS